MDDPITAILTRDWASIGGWGLFISLTVFVVVGAFREWWVPGPRHRRTEHLLEKSVNLITDLKDQNGKLIQSNEITKHFFEEVTPRRYGSRGGARHNAGDVSEADRGGDLA